LKRRRWIIGVGFVLTLVVAVVILPLAHLKDTSEIDWPDVMGETSIAVLALVWLGAVDRMTFRDRIFWPFALGMVALYAAALQDVFDEFLDVAFRWASVTENVGKLAGTLLISLGSWRWLQGERAKQRELEESSERWEKLSVTDRLTGLFNRAYFFEKLDELLGDEEAEPVSLIVMDLDDFKRHNDTYGHLEGDKVIQALARVIKSKIRDSDIACRYGGEEFTVLLPGADADRASAAAERIREGFAELVFEPKLGEKVCKTVSLGVAQAEADETPESLVERADLAMFDAKKSGKNRTARARPSTMPPPRVVSG